MGLNRNADDITLVAVTKTHPPELIDQALQAGISHFGENKVQEAVRKIPFLNSPYTGFHFIGHLQSNKINQLLHLRPFLIQSVDSFYIAGKLNQAAGNLNIIQDILIQVNTTGEATKTGITLSNAVDCAVQISSLKNIRIKGLMTIGLFSPDPNVTRPFFRDLHQMFEQIKSLEIPRVEMEYLSMGMTDDYIIALEEGSNMLRIGSAIFGQRDYLDSRSKPGMTELDSRSRSGMTKLDSRSKQGMTELDSRSRSGMTDSKVRKNHPSKARFS